MTRSVNSSRHSLGHHRSHPPIMSIPPDRSWRRSDQLSLYRPRRFLAHPVRGQVRQLRRQVQQIRVASRRQDKFRMHYLEMPQRLSPHPGTSLNSPVTRLGLTSRTSRSSTTDTTRVPLSRKTDPTLFWRSSSTMTSRVTIAQRRTTESRMRNLTKARPPVTPSSPMVNKITALFFRA